MKILDTVSQFIVEHDLLKNQECVIVGLSGGSDSVALLHILLSLGYKCIAAHCNFHLRGEESLRDENFVKKLCCENNIELHVKNFDTVGYASRKQVSIEMAARELRYAWFEELSVALNVMKIAIAHHQDDSTETVLLNLVRGTGIKGLTGIPVRNGIVIRPLLSLSKGEVNQYIRERGLECMTDATNSQTIYQRNKIRLELLPLLEEINPSVKKAIVRMSRHLSQVENIYNDFIEKERGRIQSENKISISELIKSMEPETVLFELISPYGFNSDQTSRIYKSLDGISGKLFFSANYRLIKDRDTLILEELSPKADDCYLIDENANFQDYPIKLEFKTILNPAFYTIPKSKNILSVDKGKLTFPLVLRRWRTGDWFVPFGGTGRKKVSDYFSDNKFSISEKESTWILSSGDKIVWIVGHRVDNRFRIDEKTTAILTISIG